jgi:prepilin-type N-terminal cleavage/methylation domain-containing protein
MSHVNSGFSLIELLLVIALFSVLSATAAPFASSFVSTTNFNGATDMVISTIRKAQNYSMNNKNNSAWGVCLNDNKIRLFAGACVTPTFSEDFSIPNTVSITGLNTITFSQHRGEPSSSLSIVITNGPLTENISLNAVGGLQFD